MIFSRRVFAFAGIAAFCFLVPLSAGAYERLDYNKNGFPDAVDMANGYSPVSTNSVRWDEADSDGDGFTDKMEIEAGHDPLSAAAEPLAKALFVDIKEQTLSVRLGYLELDKFQVATGIASWPTPRGNFWIRNKAKNPFAKSTKLYLPYWMGFGNSPRAPQYTVGFHGTPRRADGTPLATKRYGEPASNGCIRVPEEKLIGLFSWTKEGTAVRVL